ncbi:unnamed protein product [Linum trigynum]|uniref:Pyrophosphate--fructose 6-phosphate 1-phosphotransferase subunit alpha n=1 Tax=Linum trigynum TaxID=586398 RepID=A0AAV2CCJ4_9ROSI
MASNPPFQVMEDQTDEDFFDKLVDDDFGPNSSDAAQVSEFSEGSDSDEAKAFANLSIEDVNGGGEDGGVVEEEVRDDGNSGDVPAGISGSPTEESDGNSGDKQLLLHPEFDDSAQLSQIETEKLLAHLVEVEMNKRQKEGTYKGKKFNAICHFFGYQARGSLPSKFDCDYAYVLGHICYHILAAGLNGYMATVTNLKNPVNKWRCAAAPITAMLTVNRWAQSPGAPSIGKPAIHPATVDLNGKAYGQNVVRFLLDDLYRNPGPLQFDGRGADAKAVTLCVEDQDYMGRIKALQEYLDKVRTIVKPGCSSEVLKAALSVMASVTAVLTTMSSTPSNGLITL